LIDPKNKIPKSIIDLLKKRNSRTLFSSIAPIKANRAFLSIAGRGNGTYEGEYF
jgi:hypothetical protein